MRNVFIISGPSGAGEDSVIAGLKEILPVEKIVTSTTRPIRPGEENGRDYYFISQEEFKSGLEKNSFLEYAQEYNGLYYGVTVDEIRRVEKSGRVGIWKIEYKGVITAKKMFPDIIAIYLGAPLEVMEDRIRKRDGATEEYIKERMEYTKEWLKHLDIYDYQVENKEGKLDETIEKVANIIKKHLEPDHPRQ